MTGVNSNGSQPATTVVTAIDDLARQTEAWHGLASKAIEANAFYEPMPLLLALEHLKRGVHWQVVLIHRHDELIGLIPLQRYDFRGYRSASVLQLLRYSQCFLHTPLIHRDAAEVAIGAFLDWCVRDSRAGLILCPRITIDGPVAEIIRRRIGNAGGRLVERERFERPLLVPGEDADSYLNRRIRHKRRHQLKRQRARLEEMGSVAYSWLDENGDAPAWIDEFVKLEGSGWKGSRGGALNRRQSSQEFFRRLIIDLHQGGHAVLTRLALNDRPIAMSCQLRAAGGGHLFCFKTAYDEELKQLAPGILQEIEFVRRVHEPDSGIRSLDSCTSSGKELMLSRIWSDSVAIGNLDFAVPGLKGRALWPIYRFVQRYLKDRPDTDEMAKS